MNRIITFDSHFGPISVELDDYLEDPEPGIKRVANIPGDRDAESNYVVKADKRFDQALNTLRGYAGTIQQVIGGLEVPPQEVSVQVGLKLKGEAGFVIAKAGSEAEMTISLKWEPRPKADS